MNPPYSLTYLFLIFFMFCSSAKKKDHVLIESNNNFDTENIRLINNKIDTNKIEIDTSIIYFKHMKEGHLPSQSDQFVEDNTVGIKMISIESINLQEEFFNLYDEKRKYVGKYIIPDYSNEASTKEIILRNNRSLKIPDNLSGIVKIEMDESLDLVILLGRFNHRLFSFPQFTHHDF